MKELISPPLLIAVLLFVVGSNYAAERTKAFPLWDGTESVADYAKRVNLPAIQTLDLGKGVKLELVLIPAGKFIMGTPEAEKKISQSNEPQHPVTLTRPFYMGKFAVTQKQYEAVIGTNPSRFVGVDNPVDKVTWIDADAFCKKLSLQTKKPIRLPTEAEWEYSCRAGTITKFYSGDTDADCARVAWYVENSGMMTHPVGQKDPNAFGLYDMHGNVWQWCQDWFDKDYYGKSEPADPQGPATGTTRSLRGGSWTQAPNQARAGNRNSSSPSRTYEIFGFRIVASIAKTP